MPVGKRRRPPGAASPLDRTLAACADFFTLFENFCGLVEFFLLQDLLNADGTVAFFLPFSGFDGPALPATPDEYRAYRDTSLAWVRARNARIDAEHERRETY